MVGRGLEGAVAVAQQNNGVDVVVVVLDVTTSCLPSPLKSASATESGYVAASVVSGGAKVPSPLPSSTFMYPRSDSDVDR